MLTRLKKEAVAAESVGSIKEWRESAAEICEFVGHGQDMSPLSHWPTCRPVGKLRAVGAVHNTHRGDSFICPFKTPTKKPGVWLPAFWVSKLIRHGVAFTRTKIDGAVSGMAPLRVTSTVCTSPTVPVTVWVAVTSVGQAARSVEVCTV